MIKSQLTKETIYFNEIKFKVFKKFIKDTYGTVSDEDHFFDVFYEFLEAVLGKNKEWIEELSYLDLICLLIDCRLSYGANAVKLSLTIGDKLQNIELNLNYVRSYILENSKQIEMSFVHDRLKINLTAPSYKRLPVYVSEIPFCFIDSVTLGDSSLKITSNKQAEELLKELPVSIYNSFISQTNKLWEKMNDIDLFHNFPIKEQLTLSPYNFSNLIWYVKLFFNEDLGTLYKNTFYLVYKGNFDAKYIDDSTVGEYMYYVNCLISEITPKEESQTNAEDFDDEDIDLE